MNTKIWGATISQSGIIKDPVLVNAKMVNPNIRSEKYYVLAGNRTTFGLKEKHLAQGDKLSDIEVTWKLRIYTGPNQLVKRQMLLDLRNDNRGGLNFTIIDNMKIYLDLKNTGMSLSDIARSEGKSTSSVEQVVALSRLSEPLIKLIRHKAQEEYLLTLSRESLDNADVEYECEANESDPENPTLKTIKGINVTKAKLLSRLISSPPKMSENNPEPFQDWMKLRDSINESIECDDHGILTAAMDDSVRTPQFKEYIRQFKFNSDLFPDVDEVFEPEVQTEFELDSPNENSDSSTSQSNDGPPKNKEDDPSPNKDPEETDVMGPEDDFEDVDWYDENNIVHVIFKHDKKGFLDAVNNEEFLCDAKFEKHLVKSIRKGDAEAIIVLKWFVENDLFCPLPEAEEKFAQASANIRLKNTAE